MKNYHLLSVDWDYFFPSIDFFDWGHRESNELMGFFFEMSWEMRAYSVMGHQIYGLHKYTGDKSLTVKDYLQPNLDKAGIRKFWRRAFPNLPPTKLFITESHSDLYTVASSMLPSCNVYSFDAHHDGGYGDYENPGCDNWAYFLQKEGWMGQYHIIYPKYRRKMPEQNIGRLKIDGQIHHRVPKVLPNFDYLFICRSSAWTPSWADDLWLEFINYWASECQEVWSRALTVDYVMGAREFRDDVAKKYQQQTIDAMRKMGVNVDTYA